MAFCRRGEVVGPSAGRSRGFGGTDQLMVRTNRHAARLRQDSASMPILQVWTEVPGCRRRSHRTGPVLDVSSWESGRLVFAFSLVDPPQTGPTNRHHLRVAAFCDVLAPPPFPYRESRRWTWVLAVASSSSHGHCSQTPPTFRCRSIGLGWVGVCVSIGIQEIAGRVVSFA